MSELLLKEKLRTTKKAEVRDVARTRTISVMRGLDTERNNLVIQFLREANLITDKSSILNYAEMDEMDLQNVHLEVAFIQYAYLASANLQGALLHKTNLRKTLLAGANLQDAILVETNLQKVNLWMADLRGALMEGADLQEAYLMEARVTEEQLATVKSLKGATMPDGTIHE